MIISEGYIPLSHARRTNVVVEMLWQYPGDSCESPGVVRVFLNTRLYRGPGTKRTDRVESGVLGSGGNAQTIRKRTITITLAAGPVDRALPSHLLCIRPSAAGRCVRPRFLMGLVSSEPHEFSQSTELFPCEVFCMTLL